MRKRIMILVSLIGVAWGATIMAGAPAFAAVAPATHLFC